jgi:hypothetical protein
MLKKKKRRKVTFITVTTTQSVLANQEELPSDDDTFKLLEDLPDPNPVDIPEPTTEFISNPTVDSIPVLGTTPVFDCIPNNSGTSSVPLISLVLRLFL